MASMRPPGIRPTSGNQPMDSASDPGGSWSSHLPTGRMVKKDIARRSERTSALLVGYACRLECSHAIVRLHRGLDDPHGQGRASAFTQPEVEIEERPLA